MYMTTHTNTLVRIATVLTGGAVALGSLFVAAPALANYNGNNYNQGVGVGNVCTSRTDPFCIIKETNYLNNSPYNYSGNNNSYYGDYNQYNNYGGYQQQSYNYTPNYSYNTYNPYQSQSQY